MGSVPKWRSSHLSPGHWKGVGGRGGDEIYHWGLKVREYDGKGPSEKRTASLERI